VKNIDSLRLSILRALELRSHPCSPAAMAGMSRNAASEMINFRREMIEIGPSCALQEGGSGLQIGPCRVLERALLGA
jgi:hypothetical protein